MSVYFVLRKKKKNQLKKHLLYDPCCWLKKSEFIQEADLDT